MLDRAWQGREQLLQPHFLKICQPLVHFSLTTQRHQLRTPLIVEFSYVVTRVVGFWWRNCIFFGLAGGCVQSHRQKYLASNAWSGA